MGTHGDLRVDGQELLAQIQTPTAIGAYGNWPENAHVGVWLRWVVFFGVAGEENKARAVCRAGASKIPGRPPPL